MRRSWFITLALLALTSIAAAVALTHMDNLLAFIVIGPGYVVQAWLFQTHRAPGGWGYVVTMVAISALTWTLILLILSRAAERLLRRVQRHRELRE